MSQFTTDRAKWFQAFLDTPVRALCVKSVEREPQGWPKNHGRIAKPELIQGRDTPQTVAAIRADEPVTVIGYDDPVSPPFIWTGTGAEFRAEWEID